MEDAGWKVAVISVPGSTPPELDAGMAVLAKPFAMSTLANKVREMLESRS